MREFRPVEGFEDVWRLAEIPRRFPPKGRSLTGAAAQGESVRARLSRLVAGAPEVVVKITGRTKDLAGLCSHLDYISRKGGLEVEDRDGNRLIGRAEMRELAEDWAAAALLDSRRRKNSPVSHSIVLSMPAPTDPPRLREAARNFARATFGDWFDYVFVQHAHTDHPHIHLSVRSLGDCGERLNLSPADLHTLRQDFAGALRQLGIAAEATSRWSRGVTRKGERLVVRKIREGHEEGRGQAPRVQQSAYREAAQAAFMGDRARRIWEEKLLRRQEQVRGFYLAQASRLISSADPADRDLGRSLEEFVGDMPAPDTRRLALAREMLAADHRLRGSELESVSPRGAKSERARGR